MLKKHKKQPQRDPVASICTDIEKITFATFLKCSVNSDFSGLILAGKPSPHQLFFAWISVLSEYYTLVGSKDALKYVKLVAGMEKINLKIDVVTSLVATLRDWYDPRLCEALKNWGFRLQFTSETLNADLVRVELELQNDNFQLEKLKLAYDKENHNKKATKATKEQYMRILYAVEKHRGQRYPPDKLSVYEFAMFYLELQDYSAAMKEAYKK